jgi:hypothetical protein
LDQRLRRQMGGERFDDSISALRGVREKIG